jgi:hypothetical protein
MTQKYKILLKPKPWKTLSKFEHTCQTESIQVNISGINNPCHQVQLKFKGLDFEFDGDTIILKSQSDDTALELIAVLEDLARVVKTIKY